MSVTAQALLFEPPAPDAGGEVRWREVLALTVWGEPVAKGRPRWTPPPIPAVLAWARQPRPDPATMPRGRMHTPATTAQWTREVQLATQRAMRVHRCNTIPPDVPVRVDCDFVFARRAQDYQQRDPDCRILKTTKPDRDNLEKAILDGLETAGLLSNDSQVCAGEPRKWWGAIADRGSKTSERPHVRVVVSIPTTEAPDG